MTKKLSFIDGLREYRDTLRVLDILYRIEKKNPIRPVIDNFEN